MMTTTCIIPVYNEFGRIGSILRSIEKLTAIDQIICVDESNDGSDREIANFSRVQLIHFTKRLGKAEAVKVGLKYCTSENVLLMDSDFIGVGVDELARGIEIFEHNKIDMLVFRQKDNAQIYQLLKLDLTVSGERILKTKTLTEIISTKVHGYQLEMHINDYFIRHPELAVYHLPLAGHNVFKFLRRGWKAGLKDGITMMRDTIGYRGLRYYMNHVLTCHWKEWSERQ